MTQAFLARLLGDERAAVTTEWVTLTAAIAGLGILTVLGVRTGAGVLHDDVSAGLTETGVAPIGTMPD